MKHRVKLIVRAEKKGSHGLQGVVLRPQFLVISKGNKNYRYVKQIQRVIDYSCEDLRTS